MKKDNFYIETRDIKDGDWYWIQRVVYEDYAQKIGVVGLALYNAYASYAINKGFVFPSQKTISLKLKISIPTISKYNRILEKYGLIKIKSGKRAGVNNVIYLLKICGKLNKDIKELKTGSKLL